MVDMSKVAYVRMRGDEWFLKPETAQRLNDVGIIWRDYDCERNTEDNGYPNEGPCYGVSGESESVQETSNAALLDKVEDG
jgi:hypothetical protein